ncbi:M29 family metallopeptidase [Capillimicrobium parvum]|uniref:2,5-dihydroxypyridine 5,6-dioxygenase n=1 Tax=Capillimicrobium parvum TaxID=2884022 RepID=A0A9E6Y0A8_9ACTN|nr:2,5-dihydroxypyridine 5,6-dioxygenase [Capillimicrobium parvum]UGS37282.1 2,5-dihydroxypyridine 5,6-dioxygenase [Capillimicrobium parvum]
MIRWADFAALCKRELELCAATEGETVVVLSQGDDRLDYADAFLTAARDLGAYAYNLRLSEIGTTLGSSGITSVGVNPLARNPAALRALQEADLVIDLVFLLWSKEQIAIQASGTRMLMVIEPVDLLARMFPTREQKERVQISAELLAKAKTLRLTNPAGSDVTYQLGAYPVIPEWGFAETRGRWDSWPGGFAFTGGADDGVDGRLVVDRGDILVAPFNTYVSEPIELTIEHGVVTDIRGGHDAELLQDYLDEFDDPRGYACSHIGWGVNENARWSHRASRTEGFGQEARAFYGNVMFALGPNQELGGSNDTPAHIDIPMRGCSVYLDDEPVIVDGRFTIPELQVSTVRATRSVRSR